MISRIIVKIIVYIINDLGLFLFIVSLYLAINIRAVIQMDRETRGEFRESIIVRLDKIDGVNI